MLLSFSVLIHLLNCELLFMFSYSDIIIEREVLMQKYIHLIQIVETEKVAANQLRTQLEDQDTEIERLKAEVQHICTHSYTCSPPDSLHQNPIFTLCMFGLFFLPSDI